MTATITLPPANVFPPRGPVHTLLGAAIHSAYYGTGAAGNGSLGKAFQPESQSRRRVRFMVRVTLAAASTVTIVTVKLKQSYGDGAVVGAFADMPSNLDDVQGSAQPKGQTLEVEHAFGSLSGSGGPNVFDRYFYLDVPDGLCDVAVDVHADAAGNAADSVVVYASTK